MDFTTDRFYDSPPPQPTMFFNERFIIIIIIIIMAALHEEGCYEKSIHTNCFVCKGLSNDDVGAERGTVFQEIRPGAVFKTGGFVKEKLGGGGVERLHRLWVPVKRGLPQSSVAAQLGRHLRGGDSRQMMAPDGRDSRQHRSRILAGVGSRHGGERRPRLPEVGVLADTAQSRLTLGNSEKKWAGWSTGSVMPRTQHIVRPSCQRRHARRDRTTC